MKMEVGFDAPVAGVVTEVRARKGEQVAAGDVMLVIEPKTDVDAGAVARERLALPELADPLDPLFSGAATRSSTLPISPGADAQPGRRAPRRDRGGARRDPARAAGLRRQPRARASPGRVPRGVAARASSRRSSAPSSPRSVTR